MAVIKIGLVGCGGRGGGAAWNALNNESTKEVKLVAVADAFKNRADSFAQQFSKDFPEQTDLPPERRFVGLDCCEQLLQQTDCDVVLLCQPPGFRPRAFRAAIDAGKHVFAEKPVAVDAPGVRIFMEANEKAKRNKQSVLVGHHLRFEQKHFEPIRMLHEGVIGELLYTRIFFNTNGIWNRPRQADMTEMQFQVNNWYHFNWLSGDHIVEQHVHDIDVMNWFVGDQPPDAANGMGGRILRPRNTGEIFDYHHVEYTYPNGVRGFSACRQIPNCWDSFSEHAYGTKGHLDIDGHGIARLFVKGKDPQIWQRNTSGHQVEMDVLFDHVARGQEFNNGDTAAASTMTSILGRMATYSGKVVTWDDAMNSELDTFPPVLAWDAEPGPKPDANGNYPCAVPGVTRAW